MQPAGHLAPRRVFGMMRGWRVVARDRSRWATPASFAAGLTISEREQYDAIGATWPELTERIDAVTALVDWDKADDRKTRGALPELGERIDRMVELVDWDVPTCRR